MGVRAINLPIPFARGRLLWLPGDVSEAIRPDGLIAGHLMFNGHLNASHFRGDELLETRDLGYGVVTNAGAAALVDYMVTGTPVFRDFYYHDSGIGTNAAVVGDTGLQTEAGPTTRATGSRVEASTYVYRSVGTIAYTTTLAITEWGLFNDATRGSDTMWDRRVFTAINVINGDSIEFTYDLTVNSGG